MFNTKDNSGFIDLLIQKFHLYGRKVKIHLDYCVVSLLLVISLYNILLYNLKILEISWDGAAHSSNGIILHDMIRDIIIRDHNFSLLAMYRYILVFNLEWYPSLGGTIAYFPLFIPFLFMLSYYLFGISYSSALLVIIIMGNICVITTFFLGKELFDKRIGLLSALFLAFSSAFFAYSKTALLDPPAATMFTLSIYSLVLTKKRIAVKQNLKKQAFLTGTIIGLAFMTKPTCVLIFPAIILYFVMRYGFKFKDYNFLEIFQKTFQIFKNNLWIFYGIIPAFILIGFQLGIFVFSGMIKLWISPFTNRGPESNLIELQVLLFYITGIGLTIPVIGGFLFGLAYATYRRTPKDKLLLSWYFTVYLTFIFIHTRVRFFLIAFPVIFLLLSRGIIGIYDQSRIYYHHQQHSVKIGTIALIGIVFLFGFYNTLQHPYPHFYTDKMPATETPMEDAALFLTEKKGVSMQMTLNPTISASAMTFYTLKYDREHETRYYDTWWATKRGTMTIDEFEDVIKQLNVSYLLISEPGNDPKYEILDKYINFVLEKPKEFSLVRVFEGDYSIYIYKVQDAFY